MLEKCLMFTENPPPFFFKNYIKELFAYKLKKIIKNN